MQPTERRLVSRSRTVKLTILDVCRMTVLPSDWDDKDTGERIAWLTSWANDAITDIVIDTDETRRDG
jgi:hypothetical protein